MPGQPDCGPARHHALTHEIFKISDTREGRQAQGSTNSNPSPSSSRRRRRRVSSPFASMRNFPTGLTCTLNNRRCSVRGAQKEKIGNRNSPVSRVVANRRNGSPMTQAGGDSSETKPRLLVRLICCLGDFEELGRIKWCQSRDGVMAAMYDSKLIK